jgi:hypothetical protein
LLELLELLGLARPPTSFSALLLGPELPGGFWSPLPKPLLIPFSGLPGGTPGGLPGGFNAEGVPSAVAGDTTVWVDQARQRASSCGLRRFFKFAAAQQRSAFALVNGRQFEAFRLSAEAMPANPTLTHDNAAARMNLRIDLPPEFGALGRAFDDESTQRQIRRSAILLKCDVPREPARMPQFLQRGWRLRGSAAPAF